MVTLFARLLLKNYTKTSIADDYALFICSRVETDVASRMTRKITQSRKRSSQVDETNKTSNIGKVEQEKFMKGLMHSTNVVQVYD